MKDEYDLFVDECWLSQQEHRRRKRERRNIRALIAIALIAGLGALAFSLVMSHAEEWFK